MVSHDIIASGLYTKPWVEASGASSANAHTIHEQRSVLHLPTVTLCAVDCVNPVLTLRALDLCGRQCRFGEVIFLSDRADQYELAGCQMMPIPSIASRADYSHFVLKRLGDYIRTPHVLLVKWDGYIVNPDAWKTAFLDYDYIGAPWGSCQDEHRIGNGEFSLRSRRLLNALADTAIVDLDLEDEATGRLYRTRLEKGHGIRFAPLNVAEAFSFETTRPVDRPFGFHGLVNMWRVLPREELPQFVAAIAPSSVADQQFLQLGRNYLELGRIEEAKIVFARRLEVMTDDAEARGLLASIISPGITSAQAVNRRVGRNDPCPCGSGKRYKSCCGQISSTHLTGGPEAAAVDPVILLQDAMDRHQAGRLESAEAIYRRLLADDPKNAMAMQYLGVLSLQKGDPVQAEVIIRRALDMRADIPDFHSNLGLCLREQGRLREAQACYRKALAVQPDYAAAYNNLGLDLLATMDVAEAVTTFKQALQIQPAFAEAHWNLGLAYLLSGRLTDGWAEYEWRLDCQRFAGDGLMLDNIPPWRGEAITGKTLLVRREQGLGDTVQFLRFVPQLTRDGARVLLDVTHELAELALTIAPGVTLFDRAVSPPVADLYVNLMSLPYRLGITLDNLPRATPYLFPDRERVAWWQKRLAPYAGKKIGVVWAGNPRHGNDRNRSCPLDLLAPLFELSGASWFSLQKGPPANQLAALHEEMIVDLGPELKTVSDTAAALTALDLLITVDTLAAHVAGALGRPAWVMIPYAPDWRWLLSREDSPWYPSVRLFRQQRPGEWENVIFKLQDALRNAVRQ